MCLEKRRFDAIKNVAKAFGGTLALTKVFYIDGALPFGNFFCFFVMALYLLYSVPRLTKNLQEKDFHTTGFYIILVLALLGYLDSCDLTGSILPVITANEGLFVLMEGLWCLACGVVTVLLSAWGGYHLLTAIIILLYRFFDIASQFISQGTSTNKRIQTLLPVGIFVLLWTFYFIMYLNQYPGSLSCDTPSQISQAITLKNFENANPFINTAVITLCVQFAFALGGDANMGVAVYTLFQFTLFAFAIAYTARTVLIKGLHWIAAVIIGLWGLVPNIVFYAVGMWKDSFFAIFFLLTVVYLWRLLDAGKLNWKKTIILFILALITSLARNSGWTSLLVMALVALLKKTKEFKRLAKIIIASVICSVITVSFIYPLIGVENSLEKVSTFPIAIQQAAKVVASGVPLEEEEIELIEKLAPVEEIREKYTDGNADPIKWLLGVNDEKISEYGWEYLKLWINLGMRYPTIYLDGYLNMTRNYWKLGVSSWQTDNRVFENDFGIEWMPKLAERTDLLATYSRVAAEGIPAMVYILYGSNTLWIIVLLLGYSEIRKKKAGILLISGLMVYLGLMITSPIALFRYMVAPVLCLPVWFCIVLCNDKEIKLI